MKRKPTYFVVHARTMNLDLVKELGCIPHTLATYYGYDAYLVTYPNDNFIWKSEVPSVELMFLKRRFGEFIDVLCYICKNAGAMDVLHLMHIHRNHSLVFGLVYKLLHPNGILYYKLDASPQIMQALINRPRNPKSALKTRFLRWMLVCKIDLISVEVKEYYEILRKDYVISEERILHLPNGYHIALTSSPKFAMKQPCILNVARIGTYQKGSDVLLEAFAMLKNDCPAWTLVLAGTVVPEFNEYMSKYFDKHPDLRNRVECAGYISNRAELNAFYSQASIFCLTSRWEGFGIALVEAAYFGNYIVATDVGGARDILDKTKCGCIVPFDDPTAIAVALRSAINSNEFRRHDPGEIRAVVEREFSWKSLCARLDLKIRMLWSMSNVVANAKQRESVS